MGAEVPFAPVEGILPHFKVNRLMFSPSVEAKPASMNIQISIVLREEDIDWVKAHLPLV